MNIFLNFVKSGYKLIGSSFLNAIFPYFGLPFFVILHILFITNFIALIIFCLGNILYIITNNGPFKILFTEGPRPRDEFFSSLANRKKCFYLDLAKRVKVSEIDGLHLDERGHEKVGKIVASKVISIFK